MLRRELIGYLCLAYLFNIKPVITLIMETPECSTKQIANILKLFVYKISHVYYFLTPCLKQNKALSINFVKISKL